MVTVEELTSLGIGEDEARQKAGWINELIVSLPSTECWRRVSTEVLSPDDPFELHSHLYHAVFADWKDTRVPPPAWSPSHKTVNKTNIESIM